MNAPSTLTPARSLRAARPLSGSCWRIVEAQHRVSTMKVVDTVEEQGVLEILLYDTKASIPAECLHLHYQI